MNHSRIISIATLVAVLPLIAVATAGQLSHTQLLGFLSDPPPHARVSRSDAAVIGTIGAVGVGRIEVRSARVLFGQVDEGFELKRSPSQPPRLQSGERVLLLLRGARSPYLLVDHSEDLVKMISDTMEARWSNAIRDLRAALEKPGDVTSNDLAWVYRRWLDQPSHDLQRAAIAGLADRRARFHPLPGDFVRALIDTASNPETDFDVRRAAAFVAGRISADQPALVALRPQIKKDLARLDSELGE